MKTATLNRTRFLGLVLGGALLCLAAGTRAQDDPSGTWDFVISGNQQGVAFLTFEKDFTLSGFEVITSYTPPVPVDGRGGLDDGRNGPGIGTSTSNMVFFGFTSVSGSWRQDARGRTVGFINEGQEAGGDLAQSSSFTATVRAGRRLTMKVTDSPNPEILTFSPRHRVYKGIPVEPTDDLSGDFYANGALSPLLGGGSQNFTEFFTLTSLAALDPGVFDTFPFLTGVTNSDGSFSANAYFLSGTGPGYTNWGVALFSAQKRLAVASVQTDTINSNGILRSLSGSFNVGSGVNGAGRLLGTDDNLSRVSYKVRRF